VLANLAPVAKNLLVLRDTLDPRNAQAALTAWREVVRPVNDIAIISRVRIRLCARG